MTLEQKSKIQDILMRPYAAFDKAIEIQSKICFGILQQRLCSYLITEIS